MARYKYVWALVTIAFIVFFLYSFWIAPFSVQHGYYVGAAKLMAQGLVPFRDFNIMDMPLGIWIISLVYRVVGVETSGNAAVVLMMVVNVFNFFLIYQLLKRIHVQTIFRWIGLLFYVCILYSTKALMVNIGPLCVFFLLLAILFLQNHNKVGCLISAACLTLSVLCEYHVLVMMPVLFFLVLFSTKNSKRYLGEALFFLGSFVMLFVAAYLIVVVLCGESNVFSHFDLRITFWGRMKSFLSYIVILGGRCSLYFIIPGIIAFQLVRKRTRVYTCLALIAYFLCTCLLVFRFNNAWGQFLYPFIVIAFASGMQDLTEKNRYLFLLYLSCFAIPLYLCLRDYQKLEGGDLKEEQMAYLQIVNDTFPGPKTMAVFAYHCSDYDMGPQVFSEIYHVLPSNLKRTQWGLNDWSFNQYTEATVAMEEANIIVMNKEFFYNVDSFNYMYFNNSSFDLNELMDSHRTVSIGDVNYIIND